MVVEYVPAGQPVQKAAPSRELNVPAAQEVHKALPTPENLPREQSEGLFPIPEFGQYEPEGQGKQFDAPEASWKVPAEHEEHDASPVALAYRPALHAVQAPTATPAYLPALQLVQFTAPLSEYIPPAQFVQLSAPYLPAAHCWAQATAPDAPVRLLFCPDGQDLQLEEPGVEEKLPAAQEVQEIPPLIDV